MSRSIQILELIEDESLPLDLAADHAEELGMDELAGYLRDRARIWRMNWVSLAKLARHGKILKGHLGIWRESKKRQRDSPYGHYVRAIGEMFDYLNECGITLTACKPEERYELRD